MAQEIWNNAIGDFGGFLTATAQSVGQAVANGQFAWAAEILNVAGQYDPSTAFRNPNFIQLNGQVWTFDPSTNGWTSTAAVVSPGAPPQIETTTATPAEAAILNANRTWRLNRLNDPNRFLRDASDTVTIGIKNLSALDPFYNPDDATGAYNLTPNVDAVANQLATSAAGIFYGSASLGGAGGVPQSVIDRIKGELVGQDLTQAQTYRQGDNVVVEFANGDKLFINQAGDIASAKAQTLGSGSTLTTLTDFTGNYSTFETSTTGISYFKSYDKDGNLRLQSTATASVNLDGTLTRTEIVSDASGASIAQTIGTTVNGAKLDITFGFDTNGDPYVLSVNSISGAPPTDQAAAVVALNELGLTPDALAMGGLGGTTNSTLEQASGVFATFNAVNPTGSQTLFQALNSGTLIDALSLLRAIQSGDPLPVVSSGLRLAAGLDSLDGKIDSIGLAGAASIAGGALSLLSLRNALDRGDTFAAITSGAQALSFGTQAYATFVNTSGLAGQQAVINVFGADSFVAQLGSNLPYLNLVSALESGDEIGIAVSAAAIYQVPYVGQVYAVYNIVSSLFGGDDDPPPEPWGGASAGWSGFSVVANAYGEHGGADTARSSMTNFIDYLNRLAAYEQSVNPGASIGVVANRLPSISYRHYSGFELTDIDPLTGVQNYPGIKYDLTGHPYNAPAGSEPAGQSFGERFVHVALARGAIAPRWEVETAALQTQYGDPKAGLTDDCMDAGGRAMPGAIAEEERAGRNGQLAGPLSGDTQTFRPVALDLDGDGIETTGATRSVAFDVDDAGFLKNTAWLRPDDAFLILDRNLNGQIDSGRELFNNGSVAPSARGLAGMRWVDGEADGPGQPLPLAA